MTENAQAAKRGTNEGVAQSEKEEASADKISITMDKRIELSIMVGMVLLGVFILVKARGIRLGLVPDPVTSRGLPIIVGIFFVIDGVILGVLRLMSWSALPGNLVPAEGKKDEKGHPASAARALSIAAAALLWAFLLKPLGYLIVTPVFLLAFLRLMGMRSWAKIICFPIIYTLATWYIFSQLLLVILPLGPLADFARFLGLMP
jgi:putative tricarboxylic transport membrane protein